MRRPNCATKPGRSETKKSYRLELHVYSELSRSISCFTARDFYDRVVRRSPSWRCRQTDTGAYSRQHVGGYLVVEAGP